jgi:hypothetical protein
METTFLNLLLVPIGFGLLGAIEPCSIGGSLLVLGYVAGQTSAAKVGQVVAFALTRAGRIQAVVATPGWRRLR